MIRLNRRDFVLGGLAVGAMATLPSTASAKRFLIIGGGSAGSAAAVALKTRSPKSEVTLLERDPGGLGTRSSALGTRPTVDFHALVGAGVDVSMDEALGVDWASKRVQALSGRTFGFDHLIIAPGVAARAEEIDGYDARAARLMPHAWLRRDGTNARLLERRLDALQDGALVALRVPPGRFSFEAGAYARAGAMAKRLKARGLSAKIVLLEAEAEARAPVPDGVDLVTGVTVTALSAETGRLETAAGRIDADLVSFIPAQQAGDIAWKAGLADQGGWCPTGINGTSSLNASCTVLGDARLSSEGKTHQTAMASATSAAGWLMRG